MGVIDITPRRVSLGNLPGVRQVNTDTGAGLRGAAGAQLGRAVAGFGMELNRTANALEERRQRNAAWDYINKFQAAMRADDEEAAKTGIADGEDPEKWVEGRIARRGEIEKQVAKETGIDKKSLALAERHLAGFNLSTQSKWAARALSVTKGRELNAAKTAVDNAGTVLLDAMDSEDEGARMAALASWDEALANLAGQDETLGEEGIDALRRKKTEELLRSSLARKLETLTAISETQTPKEVEQTFHDFLQKFADDGTKALVNGTFKGEDGFEDDLVERDTRGMDEKAFDLAARRDIETARQKAVARAEGRQRKNRLDAEAKLDEYGWALAGSPLDAELPDEDEYRAALKLQVAEGAITAGDATELQARLAKMRQAQDVLRDDVEHPDRFAAKSDAKAWVEVKQMVADAERKNTSMDILEAAVEGIKYRLTASDYFSLWKDVREKRNKDSDRIAYQVFSAFLNADDITEDTVAIAADRGRRGSSASDSAISTLLGADNAEYMRSGVAYNPDFTIQDVDEVLDLTKEYLAAHPGDYDGADRLLRDLVDPISKAARAKAFRERIRAVRRHERAAGNAGVYSVQKAFAQEDEGKK